MSVWLCIPSKRPPEEAELVLKLWRERGYKLALARDYDAARIKDDLPTTKVFDEAYPGYATAVNRLIADVMTCDPEADWFVTGGDDVEPDLNHSAEEIAGQCEVYFVEHWASVVEECVVEECERELGLEPLKVVSGKPGWLMRTFGVMQPTGDKWGDKQGPYIERVCGSPWMGREFCRRVNQGRGPLWPEYFHMGEDEELQAVAQKLGILWQRPDLIHYHRHWGRKNQSRADMPQFLERANSGEEWRKYKELFRARQAAGFPGSELLS